MSKYFVKHEPHAERFAVYRRSWLLFKEYQLGFYYTTSARLTLDVQAMLETKRRAEEYIELLKELE